MPASGSKICNAVAKLNFRAGLLASNDSRAVTADDTAFLIRISRCSMIENIVTVPGCVTRIQSLFRFRRLPVAQKDGFFIKKKLLSTH